jgi:hypothetical protein
MIKKLNQNEKKSKLKIRGGGRGGGDVLLII